MAVLLRHFEDKMRATPIIHALVAIPYVRTAELQLKLAWCMTGLTLQEYESEENKTVERTEGALDDAFERPNDL